MNYPDILDRVADVFKYFVLTGLCFMGALVLFGKGYEFLLWVFK